MVYTRVTNTKSPWLSGVNAGDVFAIPVSHGEGRFVADDAALKKLIENGQIATQYTTPCGKVSGDITWNPNGSVCGIEGITSPDGRVFGKMGHVERRGDGLYQNVPGEKFMPIFENARAKTSTLTCRAKRISRSLRAACVTSSNKRQKRLIKFRYARAKCCPRSRV